MDWPQPQPGSYAGGRWEIRLRRQRRAEISISKPLYGKIEGLLIVTIRKNGKTLTLMNVYTEQLRPQFPVSWKTFVSVVMSEFARAKARAAGAPEKCVLPLLGLEHSRWTPTVSEQLAPRRRKLVPGRRRAPSDPRVR